MVGRLTLDQEIGVRVPVSQLYCRKEEHEKRLLVMNTLAIGDNPPDNPSLGASEIESELVSDAHTRWYSAAIIHYTGSGFWRVGIVPTGQNRWEWFSSLSALEVGKLLADTKFRRCPTDELEEKLGHKSG